MTSPTSPLYCIRFTLVNTAAYSPAQILAALQPGLEQAGATVYQTPAFRSYTPIYSIAKEGPFEGDDEKTIFEKMTIAGPSGVPIIVTRDLADPKGTRPIAEQRKAIVSAFAWNIGPPANQTPEQLGALVFALLKKAFYDAKTYTGFSWAPLSSEWEQTLVKLSPYPDRPPLPKVLEPIAAVPVPSHPAEPNTPVSYEPPIKVAMPDPLTPLAASSKPATWLWPAIGGSLLLLTILAESKQRPKHHY